MNNKLIKSIALYGIGDFIVTGVTAFLFIPLYIKFLSPQDYGVFNILNNNLVLFTYIFQFGVVSAFGRIYFLKKALKREKEYTWNVIIFHVIYSLFLFGIYILFKNNITNQLSPSITNLQLVYYSPILAFLSFVPALYYVYLRLEDKANKFVFYQILTVLLVSIFIFLSFIFFKINLVGILLSFIIANFIIWIVVIFNLKFSVNYNFEDIHETVVFAFPIFVGYIAYFFISKYSIIILQNRISLGEIGMFSLAQQIATVPSLITIAITKAVQPLLFSSESESELKIKAQKFDSNFKLILIWIVGSIIFSVDTIFHFFLPIKYSPILNVTKYLLLINLVYNFSIVENTILLYKMKSNVILIITICGSVMNIILSNLLVREYGLNGVLVAMMVAFFLNFCLSLYFSRKYIKINYDVKALFGSLFIILLFISASFIKFFNSYNLYQIILSISCFIFLTLFILLILKQKHVRVKE